MATREENIKKINEKINDELEKLDDEQLEQVAGGNICMFDPKHPATDGIYKVETEKILKHQYVVIL